MPIIYNQHIIHGAKLGVWQITEPEDFFSDRIIISDNIAHPCKRLQHLAGRYLLSELFPQFPTDEIILNAAGKPMSMNANLHFSISHCGEYAAVIAGPAGQMGIDIEKPAQKIMAIKQKFLTDAEMHLLAQLPLAEVEQYTLAWSIKEAMFKWNGEGQVDFRHHLKITSIQLSGTAFFTEAIFGKNGSVLLNLESRVINNNFLTWVCL